MRERPNLQLNIRFRANIPQYRRSRDSSYTKITENASAFLIPPVLGPEDEALDDFASRYLFLTIEGGDDGLKKEREGGVSGRSNRFRLLRMTQAQKPGVSAQFRALGELDP